MEFKAYLIKLKANSGDQVFMWASEINRRKDEALATLHVEGVKIESWFLLKLNGEDYLICYIRSQDMELAQQVAKESIHNIDKYHKQFKRDTWVRGSVTELELLVDLCQGGDG